MIFNKGGNNMMNKKILTISFAAVVFGIISLFGAFPFLGILSPRVWLVFLDIIYFDNFLPPIIFYITLLVGTIIYINTNGLNSKIITFSFLIIFFTKCLSIVNIAIQSFTFLSPILIASLKGHILWGILSYYVVDKLLKIEDFKAKDFTYENYVVANKKTRLFHYLIDVFIAVLTCSYFSFLLTRGYLRFKFPTFEVLQLQSFVLNIFYLIYYLFFELIFKTTPGKVLSGSVICFDADSKNVYTSIFIRSISRFIPFELFSNLRAEGGWHDSFSKTKVRKRRSSL